MNANAPKRFTVRAADTREIEGDFDRWVDARRLAGELVTAGAAVVICDESLVAPATGTIPADDGVVWRSDVAAAICYRIRQSCKDGTEWESPVAFTAPSAHYVRQAVIAGWLAGEPRSAIDARSGKVIFALDSSGNQVQP